MMIQFERESMSESGRISVFELVEFLSSFLFGLWQAKDFSFILLIITIKIEQTFVGPLTVIARGLFGGNSFTFTGAVRLELLLLKRLGLTSFFISFV